MDGLDGLRLRDRAVVLEDVLVLADLHVGKAAASNVEVPVGAGTDMVDRVATLCERFDPRAVVVAGDLLHSFNTVPRLIEETLDGFREATRGVDAEVVVTPGNHDTMLDVVWGGTTTGEYRVGDTVICHGHVEPDAEADRYIVGHDHPTITIEGHTRPCYLAGEAVYRGADLLMLPSFNRLVSGVEVNEMSATDFLSPMIRDADALAPVVRDTNRDETLAFPPLGAFRQHL
ncbi:MAG: putative ICC-like phosphoesterase [halophilic archaeon J07HX64]|jgi:Predicted ICC-like phosphoesterases|nr:MAG: putative ICC-like phosphoesterase [halophilic archaeon J07HX64]